MSAQKIVMNLVTNYVRDIIKSGIPLERAYLFGSYAKGNFKDNSDIDVALISKVFSGFGFEDRNLISNINILNDYINIEPVTISKESLNNSNPFINEIINTGIEIKFDK